MASNSLPPGERMRIAIVGGGAAGLSAALHLAPLVERGLISSPIDIYEGELPKNRPIGVGLWSTALEPFQHSWRKSHQLVWEDFLHYGRWVGKVGYKSPSGKWLAMSELPTEVGSADVSMPSLLFLREMDFLQALRKAVHLEELQTTVKIQQGETSRVEGIKEDYRQMYSAPLLLKDHVPTERDYHLIVAADGMNSTIRKRYGGHRTLPRLIGTDNLPGLGQSREDEDKPVAEWLLANSEATEIEYRGYTVFRGNAELSVEETGMNGVSFQTWGEGNSMRFATVPMSYPVNSGRREKQVWFATTSDPGITDEPDLEKRKTKLLESFSTWHDPIGRLIESTPSDTIMMEKGMAHKHSVAPVTDLYSILADVYNAPPPSSGPGPAIVFVGDAFMTVDPILAQGFTIAMEGTRDLANTIESSCQQNSDKNTAFDPRELRRLLTNRYNQRSFRLLHLLRATEIVQTLGQPHGGVVESLCRYFIRPAMRLTPGFIKTPIFNWMLKYSLGVPVKK
jgi:2-polyprenyl-6-methoxyphenol hydroxylase-like FAD-dependent oxidoreductase